MGKNRNGRRKKAQQSDTPPSDEGEEQPAPAIAPLLIDFDPPARLEPASFDDLGQDYDGEVYGGDAGYDEEAWLGEERGVREAVIEEEDDGPLASAVAHIAEPALTRLVILVLYCGCVGPVASSALCVARWICSAQNSASQNSPVSWRPSAFLDACIPLVPNAVPCMSAYHVCVHVFEQR
jgi:hypothetical protein